MATALLPYRPDQNPLHHTIANMVVRAVQDAFNAHDPDRLAASFAERTAWTNVMGVRLDSRRDIEAFGRTVMPKLAQNFARYEVANILAIRPDVLAVNVLQTPTDRDGGPTSGQRAVTLFVVAREPDGWKIVAGQNTLLAEPV